jgi:beta-lactamase regulating signal transducer with metallopeptidase domain
MINAEQLVNPVLWPLALDGVENFILINTALSVIAFIIILAIRRSKLLADWQPQTQARLYTAGLILPPLISIWLVAGSLLPIIWLGLARWRTEHHARHELHLLNPFTASFDPILGYAALLFVLGTAIIAIYTSISAYFRINTIVCQLEIGADPIDSERIEQVQQSCQKHSIDVGLVVSRYPFSFIWGYLNSKLIVSTGLLNALNQEELAGLLAHEVAHHHRRDNLFKWLLTICRYTSPAFPLSNLLYRWRNAQVEIICDEIAAQHTQTPIAIANALVRLKRLTSKLQPRNLQPIESGFFGEESDSFEHRVTRLINISDGPTVQVEQLTRSWLRSAAIVMMLFTLSLIALFATSPLAVHRALEAILHS